MPSKTIVDFANQVKSYALGIKDQQVLGAWNLFDNTGTTTTDKGVTWTKDEETKTFTSTNTASGGNPGSYCIFGSKYYPAGTYYLSGCPEGGDPSTYQLLYRTSNNGTNWTYIDADFGDGLTITLSTGKYIRLEGLILNDVSGGGMVWKPMIALQPNQPYVPGAMTNRELTEVVNVTSKFNFSNEVNGDLTLTKLYRNGNVLLGNICFTLPSTIREGIKIGTIANELFPMMNNYALGVAHKTWTGETCGFIVFKDETDQFVTTGSQWTPSIRVIIHICYLIR